MSPQISHWLHGWTADIRSYQSVFVIIPPFSPSSWKAFCTVGLHNWVTAVRDADASQVDSLQAQASCNQENTPQNHMQAHRHKCTRVSGHDTYTEHICIPRSEGIPWRKKNRFQRLTMPLPAVQHIFIQFTRNEPAAVAVVKFCPACSYPALVQQDSYKEVIYFGYNVPL